MLLLQDGSIIGTVGGGIREGEIIEEAKKLLLAGDSRLMSVDFTSGLKSGSGPLCGGDMQVFLEKVTADPLAVICGAGHVGLALDPLLNSLGYQVAVLDPRQEFNTAERFPEAKLLLEEIDVGFGKLELGADDAVIIVSPGHEEDQAALCQALATKAGYIGMIGSSRKRKEVYKRILQVGEFGEKDLQRVQSPIGLDIGAESPAEIAVAIAAEVIAHFKNRKMEK
jgi:xanthine dehydrogenase accessory factor